MSVTRFLSAVKSRTLNHRHFLILWCYWLFVHIINLDFFICLYLLTRTRVAKDMTNQCQMFLYNLNAENAQSHSHNNINCICTFIYLHPVFFWTMFYFEEISTVFLHTGLSLLTSWSSWFPFFLNIIISLLSFNVYFRTCMWSVCLDALLSVWKRWGVLNLYSCALVIKG